MSNDIKHKPFVVWGGGVMSANSEYHKAVYTSNDIERERTISGWVIDNNDQIISGSGHNHSDANVFVNSGGTIYLYKPKCSTNMTCKYSIGTHPKVNNADYIWYAVINEGDKKFTSACEYYYRNPNNLTQYKKHNLFEQNSDLSGYTFSGDNTVDYSFVSTGFDTTRGEFSAMTMPNATNWEMFKNCDNLVYVSIPCEMRKISQSSFKGCSNLASYSASTEFLTEIGDNAFSGCTSLKDLYVPKYASIGSSSFANCSNASAITWYFNDNSMTKYNLSAITDYAFENCTNLKTTKFVTIPYGSTESSQSREYDNTIYIPNGIKRIGFSSFRNCTSFGILKMNGVTEIGDNAFEQCSRLSSITETSNITKIGNYAFKGCSNLSSSISANSLTNIGNYAFLGCNNLRLITSASNLTTIGVSAFTNCTSLSSITVANSLTNIGNYAFKGCSNLQSIGLDYGSARIISGIGESAFENCTNLISINQSGSMWLQNVSNIGDNAFKNCTSLTSIGLSGNSAVTIGNYAFSGCTRLSSVTIYNSAATIGNYAFSGCSIKKIVLYTENVGRWFRGNESTITNVQFGSSVKSIGTSAFTNCISLTSIVIPDSVTSIGEHAFENCTSLTSVTIGSSVREIHTGAFGYCSGLTSINIPSSVTSIHTYAFIYCNSLASITLNWTEQPSSSISTSAFDYVAITDGTLYVPSGTKPLYDDWKVNFSVISGWSVSEYN